MEYFMISAKFVPLKYYTLSSQLRRLTSFSVGCSGRRILSPGQIAVMRKLSIKSPALRTSLKAVKHFKISRIRISKTSKSKNKKSEHNFFSSSFSLLVTFFFLKVKTAQFDGWKILIWFPSQAFLKS